MDSLVLPVPQRDRPATSDEQARFRRVFFDVAPAMFIATLDQTIVAAALPTIAADLGGVDHIAWLVTAYLLCATVAAPIYGRIGDAFGRKRALLWALALFLAGSLACAIAPSLALLIAARAVQGAGGGGLMTLAQALIGEAVSPRERGRFQGWFGAIFALASTLGPVAGGVLAEHFGWRSVFWVNVPLCVVAAVTAFRLRAASGAGGFSPDLVGTPVFVVATVALLLALNLGGSVGWSSTLVVCLLPVSAGGFGLLWPVEKRSRDPLIPPSLVSLPIVWRSALCVLLFAAQLFALIVELPLLLQAGYGMSPSGSGLMLLPLTLAQVAVSTAAGVWISRTGHPRNAMAAGLATSALGLALLTATLQHGAAVACVSVTLTGIGLGTTMPAAQTMVQWAAGSSRLGTATALLSFSRSIGGVLGAAIASAILFWALRAPSSPGAHETTEALLSSGGPAAGTHVISASLAVAFRWVFGGLALLGAIAAVVARSVPDVDLAASAPASAGEATMSKP